MFPKVTFYLVYVEEKLLPVDLFVSPLLSATSWRIIAERKVFLICFPTHIFPTDKLAFTYTNPAQVILFIIRCTFQDFYAKQKFYLSPEAQKNDAFTVNLNQLNPAL